MLFGNKDVRSNNKKRYSMKKTGFLALPFLTGILLWTVLANPVCAQSPDKTTTTPPKENSEVVQKSSFPADVTVVFKNSCMACHGASGRLLTLSVLNLSKWDEYDAAKKAKKAKAICEVVTKGSMPPASYQRSNPTSVLTPAQKELICNWTKTQIPAK